MHSDQKQDELLRDYLAHCKGLRGALRLEEGFIPELSPLGQGEYNANYWFEVPGDNRPKRFVLRVNRGSQMHLNNQIGYEFGALGLLERCGRTPRPYWCDGSLGLLPWGVGVEEYLPGRPLVYETDMQKAAQVLADVHAVQIPVEACRPTGPTTEFGTLASCGLIAPQNPLLAITQECKQMFQKYRAWSKASHDVVRVVDAMMGRAFAIAQGAEIVPGARRCIANTELNSRNFLIGDAGAPSYLVDWEKPLLSVPEQDLAHFLVPTTTNWKTETVLTSEQREAFLRDYEDAVGGRFPCGELRERLNDYLTVTCLRGITWCAMAFVGYTEGGEGLRNSDTFARIRQFLSPTYLSFIWHDFYDKGAGLLS